MVVKRLGRQQPLQIGRRTAVEMHATPVDQQAEGRLSPPTGMEGAQEGIFYPDQRRPRPLGHAFAAPGVRRLPPDAHKVVGAGHTQRHPVSCKIQNATHLFLPQEACSENEKAPGSFLPGATLSLG